MLPPGSFLGAALLARPWSEPSRVPGARPASITGLSGGC